MYNRKLELKMSGFSSSVLNTNTVFPVYLFRYGLLIPKKTPGHKPAVKKPSIFEEESSDEEQSAVG